MPDKPSALDDVVYLNEYEITSEPIQNSYYRQLPPQVKTAFERLHALAQTDPHQAIEELPDWIEKYPNLPMLSNYLSVAYARIGAIDKAQKVIEENFQRHPNYLFARLNYAETLLAQGDYPKVAELLKHKFDLKLFYPRRKRFHISEFMGFMNVVGRYFVGIGERESAQNVYETLRQIAPADPATRQLKNELYPGLIQRLVRQVIKKASPASEDAK